ncbi:MAG: endonuclease/exonuclease/phosphatase family protein [Daejeonella sp.]|uniref:endonuclease/exonuclease/phosphatase family protein n=1 Tax=Daejeonella sp. JGW-45 TaxID=3034148 RepID=UPI0023EAB908|nr:endonuclease/exonuclease/phosphatase family protein [Daejeonella sp. JGW-45]
METSKSLLIGGSYVVIIISLIPLIRQDYWIFRVCEYPRLQKLFINVVLLLLLLLTFEVVSLHDKVVAVMLALNTLHLTYQVFPFTILSKKQLLGTSESYPDRQIGLFIGNVYQHNKKTKEYLNCIKSRNPDVVMLVETDKWWAAQLESLHKIYPYHLFVPLENTYGMMLLSRFKLHNGTVKYLVEKDIPSVHATIELPSGDKVNFYGLHPTPPVPTENPRTTERDQEILLVGKEAKKSKLPVIVAGDLNDVAWSYTTELFSKISGLLDPRKGRGFFNTFHAKYLFLRFPLDHIFCSNNFTLIDIKRLPSCGSDHFPIYIKLQFSPEKAAVQEEPTADQQDKKIAEKKIRKAT